MPGTTDYLAEKTGLKICFVPEFLRERCAISDFIDNHDLCVIGCHSQKTYDLIKSVHGSLPDEFVRCTPTEAELIKYFNNKKYKTDFRTEVVAGVSTFLTMAYIMFLNPVILADGGFDFGGVFTATALATALACFIAAFYAKTWPVGLAPGMGINAFIAYGVCLGMEYTPAEALGAVLVAGVVFLIISLTPIRAWLINSIPKSLKLGIGAGIGLFLAIIGFEIMGLTADNPVTLVQLGDLSNPLLLLGAGAFISMIVMEKFNIKGNIIIGIVAFSAIAWITGFANFNGVVSAPPPMTHLMTCLLYTSPSPRDRG